MARADIINLMYAKSRNAMTFDFDALWIPSMYNYLSPYDIMALDDIATSIRYSGNLRLKNKAIDDIMVKRGFKKFGGGTNRVVYKHMEDTRFLAKIALSKVGMSDGPREFANQSLFQPFVTKIFETSPSGTVSFVERVEPVNNIEEFRIIASDVFDLLTELIIGAYILDDIGTDFFMNWGIRVGFGPVLLDFPYVYKLDGNKLHCNKPLILNQSFPVCDGEIDYDIGFNKLVCTKCGMEYHARDIAEYAKNKMVILKGGRKSMSINVKLVRGDEVIAESGKAVDIVEDLKPVSNKPEPSGKLKPKLVLTGNACSELVEEKVDTSALHQNIDLSIPDDEEDTPAPLININQEIDNGKSIKEIADNVAKILKEDDSKSIQDIIDLSSCSQEQVFNVFSNFPDGFYNRGGEESKDIKEYDEEEFEDNQEDVSESSNETESVEIEAPIPLPDEDPKKRSKNRKAERKHKDSNNDENDDEFGNF